jgi:dTMP kinase
VSPEAAFEREFRKSHAISYWESGRDMSLSNDLFQSFIRYQARVRKEFRGFSARHSFIEVNGENSIPAVNLQLRKRIAAHLGISRTRYTPSAALAHLWR